MTAVRELLARLRAVFMRSERDRDTRDELETHLDLHTSRYVAGGMTPEDARRRAIQELGSITLGVEAVHRQRGVPSLESVLRDVRYAARSLRRTPTFTVVAVVTLAIGIGANSAIYSVVDGVLFRPLPYANADRLLAVHSVVRGNPSTVSVPDYVDWQQQARTFDGMSVGYAGIAVLSGRDEPLQLRSAHVSANGLSVLKLPPILGRNFTVDEDTPAGTRVAILGEGLWQSQFGGDSSVIGRSIIIDGHPTEVIGVASREVQWPSVFDVLLPTRFSARELSPAGRGARWVSVVGRLRDGVGIDEARADLSTIAARLAVADSAHNADVGVAVETMLESITGGVRTPLVVLLCAVAFVLLIACANVGSLTLGRMASRDTEVALRMALGASRARVVRQVMTESLLLAVIGGVFGVIVAWGAVRALVALAPPGLPRIESIDIDARVLAFTFMTSLLTSILFGILPGLLRSNVSLTDALRATHSGKSNRRNSRRLLVVAEVALAVVLMIGAGMLTRSFVRLQQVDPGFSTEQVTRFSLSLPSSRYNSPESRRQFTTNLVDALQTIPGVEDVGISFSLPMSGDSFGFTFTIRGAEPATEQEEPRAQARMANAGYFAAMGIPLLAGRLFDARDRAGAPQAIVISNEVARRYFGNENPIGKFISTGWTSSGVTFEGEIIGVVGDVRQIALDKTVSPHMYMSVEQLPIDGMDVLVRAGLPTDVLIQQVRPLVRRLDADVPISDVGPLSRLVDASLGPRRFYLSLMSAFAAIALLLAVVGTYGVIAYGVQLRRRELGIRIALGASRSRVLSMVLGEGLALVGVGVAIGTLASLYLTRWLQSLLYEITVGDPVTLIVAAVSLAIAALFASVLPARAAARLNPLEAIRAE